MIQPGDDRTPPMTPQLALRVAVIGTIALVMFAAIFFRLWFLQVLSGNQYANAAQGNITRQIPVAAPRGDILASDGTALVKSTAVPAVEIAPTGLPKPLSLANVDKGVSFPEQDEVIFNSLAKVLQMSTRAGWCRYEIYYSGDKVVHYKTKQAPIPCLVAKGLANSTFANVTIKTDVSPYVRDYIEERQTQSQFEGVVANQDVYLRTYPYGSTGLAAQTLGTVGAITAAERKEKSYAGAELTDVVGQTGLEAQYNSVLAGKDGYEAVKVNSANEFEGYAKSKSPSQGEDLKTSIDLKLEQVGDNALEHSIQTNSTATSGAWMAMDPQDGQVYGIGSLPSYNPSIFTHPISQKAYDRDFGSHSGSPLVNRVIDGPLPDGSTFKVITATAALESGKWSVDQTYDDDAKFCMGTLCLQNSGGQHYGVLNLEQAFEVSDDEFFYNLGQKMNVDKGNGGALQAWASKFGLGNTTGIDLPNEANGEIGSPSLQKELFKQELECQDATGIYAYTNGHGLTSATMKPGYHRSPKQPAVMGDFGQEVLSGGCGIANSSYWTEGDNVETAVGQYDDQVTPAQLAVVYAAIENGGKIVTPHIGETIESSSGQIIQKIASGPERSIGIDPSYLAAIQQGLHLAATGPTGTSTDVMGNFPEPVYGKTGTAETGNSSSSLEDSWYACYVPASATSKPIVVVVNVENGGFGDVAAAPVAREILSQWFLGKSGPYVTGSAAGDQT